MSIQSLRGMSAKGLAGAPSRVRVTASGTTALGFTLQAGKVYRVATDTTQSLTSTQMTFINANGYRVGAVMRGGLNYVAMPFDATSIALSTGTFPMSLEFEEIEYALGAAPTGLSFEFTTAADPYTGTLTFTSPAGATSIGIYWRNGTFTDLATTTSPKTAITIPTAPTFDQGYEFLVVAKHADGIWGLPATMSPIFPYQVFTASSTYTPPMWSTTADVWVVAGGGGGGGGRESSRGGGGGAGGVVVSTGVATTAPISVTVGSGGTGGTSVGVTSMNHTAGGDGGSSTFGNLTATGGGGGGRSSDNGRTGGSGGGAGGAWNEIATYNGGTGSANQGTAGGGSGGSMNPGGGGGKTNAGVTSAPNNNIQNGSAGGAGATYVGVLVAVGGQGGFGSTSNAYGSGGGGGGNFTNSTPGAAGKNGVVIVKATT